MTEEQADSTISGLAAWKRRILQVRASHHSGRTGVNGSAESCGDDELTRRGRVGTEYLSAL